MSLMFPNCGRGVCATFGESPEATRILNIKRIVDEPSSYTKECHLTTLLQEKSPRDVENSQERVTVE